YLEDLTSGNVTPWRLFSTFCYAYIGRPFARRFAPCRRLYDKIQGLWGGVPYPRRRGTLSPSQSGPVADLNLQPGELVRVKSYADILATCHESNMNRGLFFDAEMVPFCGGTYRVRARVQ